MYFCCPFKEEFLVDQLQKSDASGVFMGAYQAFENNQLSKGHEILDDLAETGYSLALVLSSMFSKEREDESAFYVRHVEYLKRASDAKDPLALYALGVYYDKGELVEQDKSRAYEYFKEAASLGMPQAEHVYGIMLYYGTGGAEQEQAKGLSMIRSAAEAGVAEASEFLQYIGHSK